jgi:hypothetical protein
VCLAILVERIANWDASPAGSWPANILSDHRTNSVEGAGFRKEPAFRDFFTLVKPFFNDIQEMKHYEAMHWRRTA